MDKSVSRAAPFDEDEREHIRRALNQYRLDHQIGVPTLRQHISIATGRTRSDPRGNDPFLIDQKTLQRFLKGSHRTNDSFLIPLAQFVSSLPAPPAANRLGTALSAFFGPSSTGSASDLSDPAHLAGAYDIFGPRTLFPETSDPQSGAHWRGRAQPSGRAVFSAESGKPLYLNISEREYIESAETADEDGKRNTFSGVLIQFGAVIFAILREQFSRLPKTYYLRQSSDGTLSGTVIEAAVRRDVESYYTYSSSDDYLFRKTEGHES